MAGLTEQDVSKCGENEEEVEMENNILLMIEMQISGSYVLQL